MPQLSLVEYGRDTPRERPPQPLLDRASDVAREGSDRPLWRTFSEQERLVEHLQTILDVLPAAVVVLDGQGRVRECNPAAEALLGQPLSGESWRDVIARAFRPDARGEELALKNGRYVTLSTCPLGKEPGQILLLTDVTETRRLRARLEQHRRLVDMGRMAANLAHQIRTPLSSALLYASQLKQPGMAEERRVRCAEKAVDSLKGLEKLINDMLLFARGERGDTRPAQPAALLRSALAALADELTARGIECRVHDEAPALTVDINPVLLESALKNLLTNALEVLGEGGHIDLVARPAPPGAVDLLVRDDGPGVPAELRRRIFEPFTTTRDRGTGLGLAVVRSIARAHRGDAWMESAQGQGSTFAIRLPARGRAGVAADECDRGVR